MRIVLSQHARLRMRERGITSRDVQEAIQHPDRTERSTRQSNRHLAKKVYLNRKLHRSHLLLVVYERDRYAINVITVIDTSKIVKYL